MSVLWIPTLLAGLFLSAEQVVTSAGHQMVAPEVCDQTLRVLFIGNSRIYYYNQPAMVAELARVNGCSLTTEMVAEGGATLEELIDAGRALNLIGRGGWNYVVVNEQSSWGEVYLVDGVERVRYPPDTFFDNLRTLRDAAAAVNAELLFLLQPRKRDAPSKDVRVLEAVGRTVENDLDVRVLPVGIAWEEPDAADLELYDPDGNHPSSLGALLSALVIYGGVFGEQPAEVPTVIVGPEVAKPNGTVYPDSIVELLATSDAEVRAVAEVAQTAHRRWLANQPVPVATVDDAEPGLQQPSAAPERSYLVGSWAGESTLYPRFLPWPATLTLVVRERNGGLEGDFRLSFGGQPTDIVYDRLPISVEGEYFQFVDPDGPNGGFVRYRIVPVDSTHVAGIAEFITDTDVYGIGSVRLQRSNNN